MTTGGGEADDGRWIVGAEALEHRPWSGEWVEMPAGPLHALSGEGLLSGRAVCMAPVTPLDPRDWRWPDDGSDEWPPCWICLALT
ncbi:MAG: hypothetical protein ACXVX8_15550 [Blastococcus sp.]